jgi:succinylglutamate desuccinylase
MNFLGEPEIRGVVRVEQNDLGPRVAIFAGVHGNEISGVHAIEKLFFDFFSNTRQLMKGKLLLARGNEEALGQCKRYIKYNLNRLYRDEYPAKVDTEAYEYKRAQELKLLLKNCDYFLDLHSAPIAQDPFLITENASIGFFKGLGIRRIITGWAKFADRSIGGDGENYAHMQGATAATLEAGSHFDSHSIEVAYDAVVALLSRLGLISEPKRNEDRGVEVFDLYAVQTKDAEDFRYTDAVKNFQFIPKGQPYAFQNGTPLTVREDSFLLMPLRPDQTKIGEEVCYLGRRSSA